jgi:hypothetical protein
VKRSVAKKFQGHTDPLCENLPRNIARRCVSGYDAFVATVGKGVGHRVEAEKLAPRMDT